MHVNILPNSLPTPRLYPIGDGLLVTYSKCQAVFAHEFHCCSMQRGMKMLFLAGKSNFFPFKEGQKKFQVYISSNFTLPLYICHRYSKQREWDGWVHKCTPA